MQCVTCGFENMPAATRAALRNFAAPGDRRHGCSTAARRQLQKKLRRAVPVQKDVPQPSRRVENMPIPRIERPHFAIESGLPPWSVTWRMIVPAGRISRRTSGSRRLFLWSTLVLLLLGLVGMGTNWGAILAGTCLQRAYVGGAGRIQPLLPRREFARFSSARSA